MGEVPKPDQKRILWTIVLVYGIRWMVEVRGSWRVACTVLLIKQLSVVPEAVVERVTLALSSSL